MVEERWKKETVQQQLSVPNGDAVYSKGETPVV